MPQVPSLATSATEFRDLEERMRRQSSREEDWQQREGMEQKGMGEVFPLEGQKREENWRQREQQRMMACMRRQATLRATRQMCENQGEGSKETKESTNKKHKALDTPTANDTGKIESEQRKKTICKGEAVMGDPWFRITIRNYKPHQNSYSDLSAAMEEIKLEEKQGQDEERERKSQQEPEDDWVVVAEDFGVRVFMDDS